MSAPEQDGGELLLGSDGAALLGSDGSKLLGH